MTTSKELIKEASERLRTLDNENTGLKEKLASYERGTLAREIVLLKVASGASNFDDIQEFEDEVSSLAESEADLGQIKTAMRYAGAQFVNHGLVEASKPSLDKSASSDPTEPEHIVEARRVMEQFLV